MISVAALQANDLTWETLDERANALDGKQKEIAEAVVAFARYIVNCVPGESSCGTLRKILEWRDDVPLADVFRTDCDASRAMVALIDDKAAIFFRLWDRITDLPYKGLSRGTHKRHLLFRSRRFGILYTRPALCMLGSYIASLAEGFTVSALKEMEPWKKYHLRFVLPNLYGLLLDESDQVTDLLAWMEQELPKRISQPFDEWSELHGFRDLILGMLASRNGEAHQVIGRIALDHRMPEYCRQTIREYANAGTREGFVNVLRIIRTDPVLSDSLAHAYCQWSGVNADAIDAENISGGLNKIFNAMTNPDMRKKYLTSGDNAFLVYQGLWATGQDGLEHAIDACLDIAAHGTRTQKIAGMYYASQFREAGSMAIVAAAVLANSADRSDVALVSLAVSCLNPESCRPWITLADLPEAAALTPMVLPFSRDDARRLFTNIKSIYDKARSTGQKWFGERIALGGEDFGVAYSLDDLSLIMSRLGG